VKAHHGKLPPTAVALYACIDIGSNTTRLLVAEPGDGALREVMAQRAFTRLGKGLRRDEPIGAAKLEEVAEVVATQVRLARELGAEALRAVATAVIRRAPNGPELCAAVQDRAGVAVEVLDGDEEARLAFVGATKTLGHPVEGEVAVADVGGGSSELALGTVADGVRWSASFRIGSGFLADAYLRSDPPSIDELEAVRQHAAGAFEGVEVSPPDLAVAVGGSATSLRRLVGARLEHETLERGVRVLASTPIAEVARSFELDPERVRLLPAGILVLEAISDRLGCPLQIGRGGLREGVILEMIGAAT
jgi:exopolyphosphatase / guanosine-5'-triphosphate,3'-diphosphate pyrophosphatase